AALLPDEAEKVDGDEVVKVAPADLVVGDVVVVRPGASVPADGKIIEGSASMDESMITGESRPVRREAGQQVVAGTVATDSGLRVEVTATGEDTALAGIQKLVADAQASSSRAQRVADTAAGWLFWFALGAAAITAVVWAFIGLPDFSVVRTMSVLVIACPHALGLAIPLVVSIATERAARGGVLVKDRLALESMRTVDAVLFDKTGTLTKGEPTVTGVEPIGGRDADEVLAVAAAGPRCWPWPRRRSRPASIRWPGRSSAPRGGAGWTCPGPLVSPPLRRSASRPRWTGPGSRWAARTCWRSTDWTSCPWPACGGRTARASRTCSPTARCRAAPGPPTAS